MHRKPKDTLINLHFPWMLIIVALLATGNVSAAQAPGSEEDQEPRITIVEGEDRQNGVLTMIKVVPEKGRPYYMVPADNSAHYESLDYKRKLYPQWVILEW